MKLQFLGTAAAEGWPALFCDCQYCREATRLGGKNIRTRSQSVVDDCLLIDFPADTYWHSLQHKVRLNQIEQLLITHSHEDHFYPLDLLLKMPPYAHAVDSDKMPVLNIYGNEEVIRQMNAALYSVYGEEAQKGWKPWLSLCAVHPFEPFSAGEYQVTPLLSDHMTTEQALFYLIEKNEKRLLYAHDTGAFLTETLDFLRGKRLDAVSLDCTFGAVEWSHGHMGFNENLQLRQWMLENGCADEKTIFVSNHFSHNGTAVYDRMKEIAKNSGIQISYDGMTIEF